MLWINGLQQEQVSASDRGLQFGDGCFTTARVYAGNIVWLEQHIARLQQDAERLRLPFTDWAALQSDMTQVAENMDQGVVKAILTRGSGGRGYSALGCTHPTRIVMSSVYPAHYARWREQGITLGISPVTLGQNPQLAGIKHLNRLEQVLIRMAMEEQGQDEVVVLDSGGNLIECCAANIFWRKGCHVFTPEVSRSGVNGVARRHLIAQLRQHPSYSLHIVQEPLSTLSDAEEVMICNALMPVVPVNQITTWCYRSRALYQLLNPNS